jgi:diadenosine tetraphosphate (Ap4A) HIT family hydrolase
MKSCQLCLPEPVVLRTELVYARRDDHELSPGHLLIVPFRHVPSFFEMTWQEKIDVLRLVDEAKLEIERSHIPDGYNIGVNVGAAAGQNRMHVHVHLIPRYRGDVADPSGGVRCVVGTPQRSR